ncbi:MAG TPA: RluA family pseudouridine synthase [Candidatus Binatia bacterium]|jgi:23S rRNA pseudouridine1911/1915/1917 synthase|nr:RluA family pseudouridine synthase [Candidatus Binatia bacterium]
MSDRTEVITIERSLPAERLDTWLRGKFPTVSRGALQRLIDEGHIRVNGRTVKPTHTPRAGEKVEVCWPEAREPEVRPEPIPLEILYEDAGLLVLNKPPGLVVHPASGHEARTLVNALLHHCQGELSGIGGVARPGIVHRLDKDTSGCMVVAKNDATHLALSAQFAGRKVEKIYHAIVCGEMARDRGEIRAAIARHSSHRKCMAVDEEFGREAHTSYRVLERLEGATLAEARLHTGRTHQIRVHFKFLGYPLVGDETYGHRQNQRLSELAGYQAPRQMLHAFHLAFIHPRTSRWLSFEAPRPADFVDAVAALRGK